MTQPARLAWFDGPDVDPRPGGPTLLAQVARHAGPVAQTVRPSWLGWLDHMEHMVGLMFLLGRLGVTSAWLGCPGLLDQVSLPVRPARLGLAKAWPGLDCSSFDIGIGLA